MWQCDTRMVSTKEVSVNRAAWQRAEVRQSCESAAVMPRDGFCAQLRAAKATVSAKQPAADTSMRSDLTWCCWGCAWCWGTCPCACPWGCACAGACCPAPCTAHEVTLSAVCLGMRHRQAPQRLCPSEFPYAPAPGPAPALELATPLPAQHPAVMPLWQDADACTRRLIMKRLRAGP